MLSEQRRSIRHLLDERAPADALEAYYAFHHPDGRTTIITYPVGASRASGYVALSRTGIDLFRPLVTMRLPTLSSVDLNLEASVELLHQALTPEAPVIVHTASQNMPLIRALFRVDRAQTLRLLVLDRRRFEPVINIFVARSDTADGEPRFVVRQPPGDSGGTIIASAGINWASPRFVDVAVRTQSDSRRQGYGHSVLASLVHLLLERGQTPLYFVSEDNDASVALAESVGFRDSLARSVFFEGALLPEAESTAFRSSGL